MNTPGIKITHLKHSINVLKWQPNLPNPASRKQDNLFFTKQGSCAGGANVTSSAEQWDAQMTYARVQHSDGNKES